MAPLTEWLKPPRTLLLLLAGLTLVSVSALAWFGWKLYEQERVVATQQSRDRLEQSANRIAAALRGAFAEAGERLGDFESAPVATLPIQPELVILIRENGLTITPSQRLLYYPDPPADPEADPGVFAEAEMFEFAQEQPAEALQSYERLARSPDAAIRAGAWLRMARVLRRMGRGGESVAAWRRLADCAGVRVAGSPADLVARMQLAAASAKAAEPIRRDLAAGRWRLSRGQFEYFWAETSRLAGGVIEPPAEAAILSEAAGRIWDGRTRNGDSRGAETMWIGGRPLVTIWRGPPERRAVLVARPESFLKYSPADDLTVGLVDGGGRLIAGARPGAGPAAARIAGEGQAPWTVYVSAAESAEAAAVTNARRFLVIGVSVMALFLILGAYVIARAIRREADLARLQSDFVSAVSHEFRSPLTTMRQLSEMLALGRAPSAERRQLYYETLVSETTRLQRVVESLLNFGRMEAGARSYHFEELDAGAIAAAEAREFSGGTHRIRVAAEAKSCLVEADPEAIRVAVRNLLDNAVKYSPADSEVTITCGATGGRVSIRISDEGPGIEAAEEKAIFQKFVRGSAARRGNVKGSGIGLAMVRHIIAAHGGDVRLDAGLGRGASFTILLPAARSRETAAEVVRS